MAIGSPTKSWTMVWKFSRASSRPWEISGWYGVYAVYQAGSFEDVPADHRRGHGVVIALADHLHGGLVLGGQGAQLGEDFDFAEGFGEFERHILTDVLGYGGVHQRVDGVGSDSLQHGVDVGLTPGADVPVDEGRGGWGNSHKELHNSGGAGTPQ